jgi:hypothetical protein
VQGWRLVCAKSDFRICSMRCVSFASHLQRTGGLQSAGSPELTCKESGLSPSPPSLPSADDKCSGYSSSGTGSTEYGLSSGSDKSVSADGMAVSADESSPPRCTLATTVLLPLLYSHHYCSHTMVVLGVWMGLR